MAGTESEKYLPSQCRGCEQALQVLGEGVGGDYILSRALWEATDVTEARECWCEQYQADTRQDIRVEKGQECTGTGPKWAAMGR